MKNPDARHRFPGAFVVGFAAAATALAVGILTKHYYWERTGDHLFLSDGGEWDETLLGAISLGVGICAAAWRGHLLRIAPDNPIRNGSLPTPKLELLPVVVRPIADDNPVPLRE